MSKKIACFVLLLAAIASTAFAGSTFQNTCSNIAYAYVNNAPTLQAVCLRANGTANATSLVLQGIGNQNGTLVQGSGASTFQQSCGHIQIVVNSTSQVGLTAYCRTSGGGSNPTSLPLNNISNNNGNLTQ
jgi:CVNH domain